VRLDLTGVMNTPGNTLDFDFMMDMSHVEMMGENPFTTGVHVHGQVENLLGDVRLIGEAQGKCELPCDRCLHPSQIQIDTDFTFYLTNDPEREDADRLFIEDGMLNLNEVARDCVLLAFPSQILCDEDCPGLCEICGADLNETDCDCDNTTIDPRLAKLAELLE